MRFCLDVVPLIDCYRSQRSKQSSDALSICKLASECQPFLQVRFRLGILPAFQGHPPQISEQRTDAFRVFKPTSERQSSLVGGLRLCKIPSLLRDLALVE